MAKTKQRHRKTTPSKKEGGETLGQRIARVRTERGFTQAELGERVGLRQSHLSDLERGRLQFSAELITRLAQELDVSADELLGLSPVRSNGSTAPRRLLRRLNQIVELPLVQQRALLKTIDAFIDRERLRKIRSA